MVHVFARRIVGWRASTSLRTDLVLDALEQALYDCRESAQEPLVHHSDRGSQGGFKWSSQHTIQRSCDGQEKSGFRPCESTADAFAESVIGLYKTEVIRTRGPWRGLENVEYATLEWVDWYNTRRLWEPIGYLPPVEHERNHHWSQQPSPTEAGLN